MRPECEARRIPIGPGLPAVTVLRPVDQDELIKDALDTIDPALPDEGTPYWAELWPAAVPLARWLLEERVIPPGERVLELGCGLGLVGIALAIGARARVALTDGHEIVLGLVREALALNEEPEHAPLVACLDWRDPGAALGALGGPFPVVIGADVLYSPESFGWLAHAAAACLAPGGALYLAEPRRPVARGVRPHLEKAGLALERSVDAANGVLVQVWRASG